MLGALDKPSAGSLYVDGKDLLKFDEKDLIKYKCEEPEYSSSTGKIKKMNINKE